jgi:hypothetical protein
VSITFLFRRARGEAGRTDPAVGNSHEISGGREPCALIPPNWMSRRCWRELVGLERLNVVNSIDDSATDLEETGPSTFPSLTFQGTVRNAPEFASFF